MTEFLYQYTGSAHVLFAILSMVFGAFIVFREKGDISHKRIGYFYIICMLGLNITALITYNLFGRFGPFHIAAVVSLLTVLGGFIPVYFKWPEKSWLEFHYEFMNWSVVGLYAAFWSETFTRYFQLAYFWQLVALATFATIAIGAYFIRKNKSRFLEKFSAPYGKQL